MKQIFKYQLASQLNPIKLPIHSKVLSFQAQNNNPCIWVMLDPMQTETEERTFILVPTGIKFFEGDSKYIGTTQLNDGGIVFHLFEVLNGE